jgi:carbamoyl-phosphate synthase small subunit
MIGYLVLENGMIFSGERIGYQCDSIFEVVFNTSMSGYIEILTDPSYTGQGVVFTYPLIGNYGVMPEDVESAKICVSAIFVHELADFASNFRKGTNLNDFLVLHKIPGLQNVNTRSLTKVIREAGVMLGKICSDATDVDKIVAEIKKYQLPHAVDLVSTKSIQTIGKGKYRIALMDFGVKGNIVKSLLARNTTVTLFPHDADYEGIMKIKPDGIVLSNGPGDPKENVKAIQTIKKLYGTNVPILGICLGHQLLALATGADTKKLKYGHRGPNHPVKDLQSKRIYISSQNHGYYIDEETLDPNISSVTFRNVNDKTVEGLKYKNKKIVTVQFHPEACAGPLDTSYLFDDFIHTVEGEPHA